VNAIAPLDGSQPFDNSRLECLKPLGARGLLHRLQLLSHPM
jgi:hypothetical protein